MTTEPTNLGHFRLAMEAFADELFDHEPTKRSVWSEQSPLFHLVHALNHAQAAVHGLETHAPVTEIDEHVKHLLSRAVMAAEQWLRQQQDFR